MRAASADGSYVVGLSGTGPAFRWAAATDAIELLPSGEASVAVGVSGDGSRVVGTYSNLPRSFVWTVGVGEVQLEPLAGMERIEAMAISGDGATVVGALHDAQSGTTSAFLWTQSLGVVELEAHLVSLGADLTGWELLAAAGVSGDGAVITGLGTFEGVARSWVVTIPGPGVAGVGIAAVVMGGVRRRRGGGE